MAEARRAGVNLHLPKYLAGRLQAYAVAQRQEVGEIIEAWLEDLPDMVEQLAGRGDVALPVVSPDQPRLLVRLTDAGRGRLNDQAARLERLLGGEDVSARRLARWLIEERLQALGEL
ncbi:hypothetical protein [Deinococcus radiotolerans]|uniref:MarR family transcriptional regulator n=1 Tax=Deinococcus radiotolerans TaxID=1309407 RepID=A0ABQ2FQ08_9DEIO|nr:hypothetical protein [Deinococcus radiotolerans]GGL15582.1 hypothetical protein GCM10010844_38090 [Deinococcus radiotolerans]